jgi:hypothetical protein
MSDNPFADAIAPRPSTSIERPPAKNFYQDHIDAEAMQRAARNMTRQQQFDNGLIGVQDLDDEELRSGRCRNEFGRIPKVEGKTQTMPRDMYEAMIVEHEQRTDQKLRENLDAAIDVMVGIMGDDTAEPKDRMDAAKYIFERIKGKTPERVHIATGEKAPWEEVFAGVARITKQRSEMLKQGVIDAEVVEQPTVDNAMHESQRSRDQADEIDDDAEWIDETPSAFAPPTMAPSHDMPVTNSGVEEALQRQRAEAESNAERIRVAQERGFDVAIKRKAANDLRQGAKKRRIVMRTMGHGGNYTGAASGGVGAKHQSPLAATQSKLTNAADE